MPATVLLVDDDRTFLHTIRRMFRRQDFALRLASSAEEALEALANIEIDVVISDERMPTMQGSELLAKVAREYPTTVRISLTGQSSIEAAQKSINEGRVFRLLTKPVEARVLAETIYEGLALREQQLARELLDPVSSLPNERALIEYIDRMRPAPASPFRHVLFLYGFERLEDYAAVLDEAGQRRLYRDIGQRLVDASEGTIDLIPSTMTIDICDVDKGDVFRGSTTFMSRCRSTEFALILQPASDGDPQLMADSLAHAFEQAIPVNGNNIYLKARCGVVVDVCGLSSGKAAVAAARAALAEAYRQPDPRRTQIYDRAMSEKLISKTSLESDFHEALESGALELHYQPIVTTKDGRMVGVEALLRWMHPARGWVSPEAMVNIAEERGLIHRLSMQTLRRACRQQVAWREMGCDIKVSVNISASDFQHQRLVARILREVESAGMEPHKLQLEVTESVVIQNPAEAIAARNALREAGVQVALDDFGTGYSSLSYLAMLKPDTLKIDRSFVTNAFHDRDAAAMLECIVKMAFALGMCVVAEGIETNEDRDYLARLDVQELQGYLFARPQRPEDLEPMLMAGLEARIPSEG